MVTGRELWSSRIKSERIVEALTYWISVHFGWKNILIHAIHVCCSSILCRSKQHHQQQYKNPTNLTDCMRSRSWRRRWENDGEETKLLLFFPAFTWRLTKRRWYWCWGGSSSWMLVARNRSAEYNIHMWCIMYRSELLLLDRQHHRQNT